MQQVTVGRDSPHSGVGKCYLTILFSLHLETPFVYVLFLLPVGIQLVKRWMRNFDKSRIPESFGILTAYPL